MVNPDNSKIAYSDLGGIYIGKNIKSDFHKHHLIAIILSCGEPFEITLFKEETGLTVRQFVLHRKLVKSIGKQGGYHEN